MIKMPQVDSDYFPLVGGLDLQTPAIALPPGMCVDAQNYEPEISGGYRRIDGYERFSGKPAPSSAGYWTLNYTLSTSVAVSDTVTGATSGATGKVLAVLPGSLVLGRVTGTFVAAENLTVAAVVIGVTTDTAHASGSSIPSDDADYLALAADDLRADIAKVPGSGMIRGVYVYNDIVYAFRDNAGGTAGDIYKSSASGWQLIAFFYELQFNAGTAVINVGDTVSNGVASGVVQAVLLRAGTWAGTAAGSLILTSITGGAFANADPIKVGGVQKATAAAASSQISRTPGGKLDIVTANFTGSTATDRMYGADGVNPAFEFDGTNYYPIRTGMTTDTPAHVACFKNHLFLSFRGSLQLSSIGQPFSWTAVLGAAELTTGEDITGMVPQGGNASGSALGVFTKKRIHTLYGTSAANFAIQVSLWDQGYSAFTIQPVGTNLYGLTARGIQSVVATQNYGDFEFASISHLVQRFINSKFGTETTSNSLRNKNQYRIYYSDGYALTVGLTGDKSSGILPLYYGRAVRCICTAQLTTGAEVTYFGSDDGYIYRDNIGTSFDGDSIEAWIRLAFNHEKSPRLRKRFRRAVLDASVDGYSKVNFSYELGYGNVDVSPAPVSVDTPLIGGSGGYWDQFTWDSFNWDTQAVLSPSISLDGTEKNLSLIFYSNRTQDRSHTLQGVTLLHSPRRTER